ncbi:cytochrome c biogenesis protein ResB [bacterium]|nr:cytochrome c biogenesis protein ResB [bacterium]
MIRILNGIYKFLCSLKLAISVILVLAVSLAAATIIESIHDTQTAQYYVYQAGWFYGVLFLLAMNILVVALSRLPWKWSHGPFLLAHLGILVLLVGSWITARHGIDGMMRVTEGESTGVVEIQSPLLIVSDQSQVKTYPVRWVPVGVDFKPMQISEYDLVVQKFITHAEPKVSFLAAKPTGSKDATGFPALKLTIKGGPMQITQEYWLWAGHPSWSALQAGPSRLALWVPHLQTKDRKPPPVVPGQPTMIFSLGTDGSLSYSAHSSSNEVKTGKFAAGKMNGQVIDPGWRGNVSITINEFIPVATNDTRYEPSSLSDEQAPPSAIYVTAGGGGPDAEVWLGMGDRAVLNKNGKEISVAYQPRRVMLPFSLKLNRFEIQRYHGTNDPSEYSSQVQVIDSSQKTSQAPVTISMNEPLDYGGVTFYQSSYEDAQPRPITSIFSVNRDPGRWAKYYGSLFLVLGVIWLFAVKYFRNRKTMSQTKGAA